MNLILATGNQAKAEHIRQIFDGSRITLMTPQEWGITDEAEEDGNTLLENALKKARHVWQRLAHKTWVISDDSGIFTHAFPGWPGVRSARWAGDVDETVIAQKFMEEMRGHPNRQAVFMSSTVLLTPEQTYIEFVGECHGYILHEPTMPPKPGMPYGGVFQPRTSPKVLAAMSPAELEFVSHRNIAFRAARDFLEAVDRAQRFPCV